MVPEWRLRAYNNALIEEESIFETFSYFVQCQCGFEIEKKGE